MGYGGTNTWYLGSLDCHKSITVVYELASPKAFDNSYYIQIRTNYFDYWGMKKTRVATFKKLWDTNLTIIQENFDQEAAVTFLAKLFIHRVKHEFKKNIKAWLDKLLVKWASVFASYIKGDEESFCLPEKMKFLPQFIYYFRKSAIYRRTGISLD